MGRKQCPLGHFLNRTNVQFHLGAFQVAHLEFRPARPGAGFIISRRPSFYGVARLRARAEDRVTAAISLGQASAASACCETNRGARYDQSQSQNQTFGFGENRLPIEIFAPALRPKPKSKPKRETLSKAKESVLSQFSIAISILPMKHLSETKESQRLFVFRFQSARQPRRQPGPLRWSAGSRPPAPRRLLCELPEVSSPWAGSVTPAKPAGPLPPLLTSPSCQSGQLSGNLQSQVHISMIEGHAEGQTATSHGRGSGSAAGGPPLNGDALDRTGGAAPHEHLGARWAADPPLSAGSGRGCTSGAAG